MPLIDLPLTELRRTVLADLVAERSIDWSSGALRRWLSSCSYADYEPGRGYVATSLGRLASEVDRAHTITLGRNSLGSSPIKGGGNFYGTTGYCSCGIATKTNEAKSKGGQAYIKAWHAEHVQEVATAVLAAVTESQGTS